MSQEQCAEVLYRRKVASAINRGASCAVAMLFQQGKSYAAAEVFRAAARTTRALAGVDILAVVEEVCLAPVVHLLQTIWLTHMAKIAQHRTTGLVDAVSQALGQHRLTGLQALL